MARPARMARTAQHWHRPPGRFLVFFTTKPLDSSTRLGVPTNWNLARLHGEVDGFLTSWAVV
eukprot:3377782-Prymnesium_polylepis.2